MYYWSFRCFHPSFKTIYIDQCVKKGKMLRLIATRRLSTTSPRLLQTSQKLFKTASKLSEVENPDTLIGPGPSKANEFPTDLDQATGLERLELLGKLEGIEIFDNKPLDDTRVGTLKDPIIIESFDDFRYVGCTGSPAGSHTVMWLKPVVGKMARCWECGSVYKLKQVGVEDTDASSTTTHSH